MLRYAAVGLAILVACLIPGCGNEAEAPPAPMPEPFVEEEPPPAPEPITQAHYDALLYDMSYRQAAEVLGRESDEMEREYIQARGPYDRTELRRWHTWSNDDGSALRACFVEDRLVEKTQDNLPEAKE